jgi:hypothetical protein
LSQQIKVDKVVFKKRRNSMDDSELYNDIYADLETGIIKQMEKQRDADLLKLVGKAPVKGQIQMPEFGVVENKQIHHAWREDFYKQMMQKTLEERLREKERRLGDERLAAKAECEKLEKEIKDLEE